MRLSHLAALIAIVSCATSATTRMPHIAGTERPKEADSLAVSLVREYVFRDSRGERLLNSEWFEGATVWPSDPGYDRYILIRGWRIGRAVVLADTVVVPVEYSRVGIVHAGGRNDSRIVDESTSAIVSFRVVRTTEGLRIASPQLPPHLCGSAAKAVSQFGDSDLARLNALPPELPGCN